MGQEARCRRRGIAVAVMGAVIVSLLGFHSAVADNIVSLTIVGNSPLQASILDESLHRIVYSNATQLDFGSMRLVVSDPRGTSGGWSISIVASDFRYHGPSPSGEAIPSAGFRSIALGDPLVVVGQPVGVGGPHAATLLGASLDTPRTVMSASPGAGSGDYEQRIEVVLEIPARSQLGIYISTLTVALTSGP